MALDSPLLLGLGGFGLEVLRQIGHGGKGYGSLWIDQKAEVLFATGYGCQDRHTEPDPKIYTLGLPGEEAREALLHLEDWQAPYPWLPKRNKLRWLSELGTYSTSGFRVLGRMSLIRSHRILDAALRRAVAGRLGIQRQKNGDKPARLPPREVFLIASADGGTGSAILTDVTLLLSRLLPRATFHALLLMPPCGVANRRRFEAGAFASLFETSTLYRKQTYRLFFEGETAEFPIDPYSELWQRVFLFRTSQQPPYLDAAEEVAQTLELLIDPEISEIRRRWPEARSDGDIARRSPFSAGGGFRGERSFSRESARAPEPEDKAKRENFANESQATADRNGNRKSGSGHRLGEQVEQWQTDLDQLYEVFRSLRFCEQQLAHQKLWQIEEEILDKVANREGTLGKETVTIEQHIKDFGTLRGQSAEEAPPLKRYIPLWRNFLFEQRVNVARKLLEALALNKLESRGNHDQIPHAGAPSKMENEEGSTSKPFETGTCILDNFTVQIARMSMRPVFNASRSGEARRLRAALFFPPEIEDREPFAAAVRHHLGIEPEIHSLKSGVLRLWWEDLHHSLEDIEGIQVLAGAYLATPERPFLHTDQVFLPMAEAWAAEHLS